jgi:acetyltransferase-like isoleucine patch superfamily enzyme
MMSIQTHNLVISFKSLIKENTSFIKITCLLSQLINTILSFNFWNGNKTTLSVSDMSFFSKVRIRISGYGNKLVFEGKLVLRNVQIDVIGNNNQLTIEDGVRFYESAKILFEGDNCKIRIGAKSTVGSTYLYCTESNTNIHIGTDCMFGREIKIMTGDFHSVIDLGTKKRINGSEDVWIGDHVWLGYHCSVSKGVKISDNSVVAAYSVVNKVFDTQNVVLAGIPAKIVKNNINWDRRKLPMDD